MTGKPKRTRLQLLIEVLAVITIVAAAFFIYTADYYHSDSSAARRAGIGQPGNGRAAGRKPGVHSGFGAWLNR